LYSFNQKERKYLRFFTGTDLTTRANSPEGSLITAAYSVKKKNTFFNFCCATRSNEVEHLLIIVLFYHEIMHLLKGVGIHQFSDYETKLKILVRQAVNISLPLKMFETKVTVCWLTVSIPVSGIPRCS
jgi:hypothetical protein